MEIPSVLLSQGSCFVKHKADANDQKGACKSYAAAEGGGLPTLLVLDLPEPG